jgi:hypothetical protein
MELDLIIQKEFFNKILIRTSQKNLPKQQPQLYLKDNDQANYLSVDVVNALMEMVHYLSTQGGRTSCPYEGAEESLFHCNDVFKDYIKHY